jgi:hypothetical protein
VAGAIREMAVDAIIPTRDTYPTWIIQFPGSVMLFGFTSPKASFMDWMNAVIRGGGDQPPVRLHRGWRQRQSNEEHALQRPFNPCVRVGADSLHDSLDRS